jgi:hypothetical protein
MATSRAKTSHALEHPAARWLSWLAWLSGLAALGIVIWMAQRKAETRELGHLLRRAVPLWLGAALLLQLVTYAPQAEAWDALLRRARAARR